MIPTEKDNQIELFTYFENWCIKNKGFYSYEMFLLAKWAWHYYE